MDIDLATLNERKRFDVKLQIALYNTALKVMNKEKKEEFEEYMRERVKRIRKLLNTEVGELKIFEGGELIFEVRE
ncbi:hypothetical protein B6U71_02025 [Euryarchaeota archaeon ex4484_178]|nr:MAG: hypothetical protein B6U71_02025 [Euryarchaeota archaeon ex4484_178]